jgi:hypothetical protein
MKSKIIANLIRDCAIIILSIIIAIILAYSGSFKAILSISKFSEILGSFLAGIFFTSAFTVPPSMVILGQIAQVNSPYVVAFWGALGALMGDLIIFRFVKDILAQDLMSLMKKNKRQKLWHILHTRYFRWILSFIGALVIASPLPDELGLAMMGFSKMKIWYLVPISFTFNFLGILSVGLIAKSLM